MPEYCEIKIHGQLGQHWSEWFAGLELTDLEEDVCLISGWLPDQAALHGLLERIRDLNLTLVSVTSSSSEQDPHADASGDNTESAAAGSEGAPDSLCAQPAEVDPQQDKARRLPHG